MANRDIFVDTAGFFALLIKDDPGHLQADRVVAEARRDRRRFMTSDYVVDESVTLLMARGKPHLASPLFDLVLTSGVCRLVWLDPARFDAARHMFLKRADQGWSFTDCTSFCIMRELGVSAALTKDQHFQHAGFEVLLPTEQR